MWKTFEEKIREIASFRWDCHAVTETIAGVKCDCILKIKPDYWVAIEITVERNVDKVRQDVNKLTSVRNHLFATNTYCECYCVLKDTPTDAMRSTGSSVNIRVQSAEEFQNDYFEYSNYIHIRKQKQFGSLINMATGEPENNNYIEVPR